MESKYSIPQTVGLEDAPKPLGYLTGETGRPWHSQIGRYLIDKEQTELIRKAITGVGSRSIIVFNYTDAPIAFYDESNYPIIVEPVTVHTEQDVRNGYPGQVVIQYLYRSNFDMQNIEQHIDYTKSRWDNMKGFEQKILRNCLDERRGASTFGGEALYNSVTHKIIEFIIPDFKEVVKKYSGVFYSDELGLVFDSMANYSSTWVHPRSAEALQVMANRPELSDPKTRLLLEVKINDPECVLNKAFINLSGEPFEVPIYRNKGDKPGIIVVTKKSDDQNTREQYFDFNDSNCPFKVFESRTLAEFNGSVEKITEDKILRRKDEANAKSHALAIEKVAQDRAKLELDSKKLEQERQSFEAKCAQIEKDAQRKVLESAREAKLAKEREVIAQDKHDREMRAAAEREAQAERQFHRDLEKAREAERIRDEASKKNEKLESVSFWRKNVSELTKVVGTVVSAAVTITAFYLKFF